jgi:hypothetical protein
MTSETVTVTPKKVILINEAALDKLHESRAESLCAMDCGIYGRCYAVYHGEPDRCEGKSALRERLSENTLKLKL